MDRQVIAQLEQLLVAEQVDDDDPDLRIVTARVESTPSSPVHVHVSWAFHGNTGEFSRPFAPEEVQILNDPVADAALAFATWFRHELIEHVSELIAAGEVSI